MNKITPFLWFDNQAEEAMKFYVSVFKNSKILETNRYGKGAPMPEGTVMTVSAELDGQRFTALNGGAQPFGFSEAISFYVDCKDQAEVDTLWERLTEGGEPGPCGWLKDKYGLSWQIVPRALTELLSDKDAEKASRVMQAMLKMSKIEIDELQKAYAGEVTA
jgi:predicted 3-demethylubiquinone-9 3-methyltransferase (glyoxalase superfamily)